MKTQVVFGPTRIGAWRSEPAIDMEKFVFPRVLGGVLSLPSGRIRSIRVIYEPPGALLSGNSAIHGVVEFDRGPGTPVQQYVHINYLISPPVIQHAWFFKWLNKHPPDAIVVKASMGVVEDHNYALANLFSHWLKKNEGVLLTDDELTTPHKFLWRSTNIEFGYRSLRIGTPN